MIAAAEFSEREMDRLQRSVQIGSIQDKTERNDDREKIEVMTLYTAQDERDTEGFELRVTVEVEDGDDNTYLIEISGGQRTVNSEYTGEDHWEVHIPYGEIDKLEISGYAIQYGVMDGDKFLLLAEEYDDVDTVQELKERTTASLTGVTVRLKHAYVYRDDEEANIQTLMRTVTSKK